MLNYSLFILDYSLFFQPPASVNAMAIINLHNELMYFLIIIFILVSWFLINGMIIFDKSNIILQNPLYIYPFAHHTNIEFLWTLIPGLLLIFICQDSFSLVYGMDSVWIEPQLSVSITGNQWYWKYEYLDMELSKNSLDFNFEDQQQISFESRLVDEENLLPGQYRLLTVDNPLILPSNSFIKFLISSTDVIHSWTVPSFGVKMDANPGRINEFTVSINRPGVFFGQCSEICGIQHGFMPIMVIVF